MKKEVITVKRRILQGVLLTMLAAALVLSACGRDAAPPPSPYADITGLYPYPSQTGDSGLYMRTLPCPMAHAAYASDNLERALLSELSDPASTVGDGLLTVGQPFSFCNQGSDIFYFPILLDGEIVLLFRTWKSGSTGEYSGILSAHLASELSALSPLTTPEKPLSLVSEGYDTKGLIGGQQYLLHTSPPDSGPLVLLGEEDTVITDLLLPSTVIDLALDTAEYRAAQ